MAIFITAYMRRSSQETITFKDASGNVVPLQSLDRVRIKIGRSGEAPLLDLASDKTVTDLHSSVTFNSSGATLKLGQDDLVPGTIKPGVYDIEACVVDSVDSSKIKHAETGVFSLHDTPLGDVSLTG